MLEFISAEQLASEEPAEPDYVVEQLLIRGAITSFSAKIKAGKTTFIGAMLKAMFTNQEHIGLDTQSAKVVYCTEEGRKTFRSFLKRTGLEVTGSNLDVLFLGSVNRALPWPEVVAEILGHCLRVNAEVIIFDTLTRWARILPDQENDAGVAAQIMEPLEILRKANLAVMGVFHDRKSGGDVSDSSRGSSAFGGAADILINLTNPATNGHPSRRHLSMVGRFDDPAEWIIDWDKDQQEYIRRNEDGSLLVERNDMKMKVQLYLAQGPLNGPALAQVLGADTADQTFRRAVKELVDDGKIVREGTGRRGNPYVYLASPFPKP